MAYGAGPDADVPLIRLAVCPLAPDVADEALADAAQLARRVGSPARAEANQRQVPSEQRRAVEGSQLDAQAPDAAEAELIARYTRQVRARLGWEAL